MPPCGDRFWQGRTNFGSQNRSGQTNFGSKSGPGGPVLAGFSAKIGPAGPILRGADFGVTAHPRYGAPICFCLVCGYFSRFLYITTLYNDLRWPVPVIFLKISQ